MRKSCADEFPQQLTAPEFVNAGGTNKAAGCTYLVSHKEIRGWAN